MGLRIEVDQTDSLAQFRCAAGVEVDGGGSLANAALLDSSRRDDGHRDLRVIADRVSLIFAGMTRKWRLSGSIDLLNAFSWNDEFRNPNPRINARMTNAQMTNQTMTP